MVRHKHTQSLKRIFFRLMRARLFFRTNLHFYLVSKNFCHFRCSGGPQRKFIIFVYTPPLWGGRWFTSLIGCPPCPAPLYPQVFFNFCFTLSWIYKQHDVLLLFNIFCLIEKYMLNFFRPGQQIVFCSISPSRLNLKPPSSCKLLSVDFSFIIISQIYRANKREENLYLILCFYHFHYSEPYDLVMGVVGG